MASIINAATSGGLITTADTSGILALQTAGTTAITVDGSQNVGIGTTTPLASDWNASSTVVQVKRNDTNGGLFKASSSVVDFIFSAGNNLAYIATTTNTPITFFTNTTERMRIGASGNVGIGTTSPVSPLNISDGAAMYGAGTGEMIQLRRTPANGNDSTSFVGMGFGNASNAFKIGYGGSTDRFRFIDGGAIEVLSLVNGGNVGIGTTSPTGKLTVDPGSTSGTRIDGLHLPKNLTAQANYLALQQGANGWRVGIPYNDSTYPLAFYYGASTPTASAPGTQLMTITAGGALVLGSTAASSTHLIKSSNVANNGLIFTGTQDVANDGTVTLTIANATMLMVADNFTGTGALFFCTYASATITLISDPSGRFATSITAGRICVTKSAVDSTVTITNKFGSYRPITFSKVSTSD